MVRRVSAAGDLRVRKRDGRIVVFDDRKVAEAIDAALTIVGEVCGVEEGRDLASVVARALEAETEGQELPVVEGAVIARCVEDVLRGAGYERAAGAFAAICRERMDVRGELTITTMGVEDGVAPIPVMGGDPGRWSKGRIAHLLTKEGGLSRPMAEEVSSSVERSLFSSGLRTVSPGLLREWIDNELIQRGLSPQLGGHRIVGLSGEEIGISTGEGRGGLDGELAVSSQLIAAHARREVYSSAAVKAHDGGDLRLERMGRIGRVDSICVKRSDRPDLSLAALTVLLRDLARHCSREVVFLWDGAPPGEEDALALFEGLTEPPQSRWAAAPVWIAAEDDASACVLVSALHRVRTDSYGRVPGLRLTLSSVESVTLKEAISREATHDTLAFSVLSPAPHLCLESVSLNLARLAFRAGRGKIARFLSSVEHCSNIAIQALVTRGEGRDGRPVMSSTLARCLEEVAMTAGQRHTRLALSGMRSAGMILMGDRHRSEEVLLDLSSSVGERIPAGWGNSGKRVVDFASASVRETFGRTDLSQHSEGRDLLRVSEDRGIYRYGGAWLVGRGVDSSSLGSFAAEVSLRLGVDATAAIPRSTGSAEDRMRFLRAYDRTTRKALEIASCA
ncbi:MAG: ATP cone domain-containing protein [Planctomycetota bacterium]|nr:ATP cone domain-containing protein [Planctomycetota bacterium]